MFNNEIQEQSIITEPFVPRIISKLEDSLTLLSLKPLLSVQQKQKMTVHCTALQILSSLL